MGNLLVSLRNAAGAMKVFERGISLVQSNVTNASTPGYAKQRQMLESLRIELDSGLPGGVRSAGTQDMRNDYAEATVRNRMEDYGYSDELVQQLDRIEQIYDISSNAGIGGALNDFFQSFSALAVAPNDLSARQVALSQAGKLARTFQATSNSLAEATQKVENGLVYQVDEINKTVGEIVELNRMLRYDYRAREDAGIQSKMSNLLESLSEMADATVLRNEDGSATIYLGGQTLVAIGDRQLEVQLDRAGDSPRLLDVEGKDVTSTIQSGRLKALLEIRSEVLPSFQAELDRLAQSVADTVNSTLAGGVDMDGQAPTTGLFEYDEALGAARTIKVSALTARQLAAASNTAVGGNEVALQVAELAQGKWIDGYTFTQFYATLASEAGRQLTEAQEGLTSSQTLTAQAKAFREELQGVNLDEEAIALLEFQRAYQASAQLIKTINEMTQTLFTLID